MQRIIPYVDNFSPISRAMERIYVPLEQWISNSKVFFSTCLNSFIEYTVINPKIITYSSELIYVEEGEGCLSVNRDVEGISG